MASQADLGHILAGKSGVAAHDAATGLVTFSFGAAHANWNDLQIGAVVLDRPLQFLHWRFAVTTQTVDPNFYGRVRVLLNDGTTILGSVQNSAAAFNNIAGAGGYVSELSSQYLHVLPVRSLIRVVKQNIGGGAPDGPGAWVATLTFRPF